MQPETAILRDVELRLQALEAARRLRAMEQAALQQLQVAKEALQSAEPGSAREQLFLREAQESSERLASLRESFHQAEKELRRTAYLVALLSEA